MVPGFGGLPAFLRGSPLLATAPALLHDSFMREFARAEVPTPCPSLPMYMIWHRRHQNDAAHRWLRERLDALAPRSAS
jgi:DNA-binding transcriptional LysR family regulator